MKFLSGTWLIPIIIWCNASLAEISPGPEPNETGNLGLVIVASETPEYIEEWLSTPSQHGVKIKRLRVAKPNQLIVTAFLVTGTSPNTEGNYQFSVNFYLLGPDEKPIFGQRDYARGKGKHRSKPTFIMADPALDIILEPSDPDGIYTIVAQVTDIVTGKKADAYYKIKFINK
ncbi:MAG: hypothetical protein OEY09_08395 [Gammaproteobacteria bacterium]|nr:hypothetical protein [Gammaproteobacteria bacterium]